MAGEIVITVQSETERNRVRALIAARAVARRMIHMPRLPQLAKDTVASLEANLSAAILGRDAFPAAHKDETFDVRLESETTTPPLPAGAVVKCSHAKCHAPLQMTVHVFMERAADGTWHVGGFDADAIGEMTYCARAHDLDWETDSALDEAVISLKAHMKRAEDAAAVSA